MNKKFTDRKRITVDELARMCARQFASIDRRFEDITTAMVTKAEFYSELKAIRSEFQNEFTSMRSDLRDMRGILENNSLEIRSLVLFLREHDNRIGNLESRVGILEKA